MRFPIFVTVSDGDVLAFATASELEGYIESVDVDDGEYGRAFDSEGRLLSLKPESPTIRRKFLWMESVGLTPVKVIEEETEPGHEPELRKVLTDALSRIGRPLPPAQQPLQQVVQEAFKQFQT